jgi:tetratricopeptide (TPR) repeat protein
MKNPKFPFLFLVTALAFEIVTPTALAAAPSKPAAGSGGSDATDLPGTKAEQASLRFQRGVSLYRERSFDAALAEFNRAYELAPNYRVLFNIGQVHVERGDFVAGIKAFRQYLKEGGSAIEPGRVTEVQAEISRLEGRIATITVTSNISDAELFVDGEPVGKLPQAHVPVNAGSRRISLRKDGYEADDLRVMLVTGEEKSFEIKLQQRSLQGATTASNGAGGAATQGQVPPAATPKASGGLGAGFWISLSATVIAGGATTAFGLLTHKANNDYDAALNRFPGSQSHIDDARRDLKRNALLTDVCGAATLVGIGSTLFFALSSGSDKPKESPLGKTSLSWGPATDGQKHVLWHVSGRF